jgi:hypothetical protein
MTAEEFPSLGDRQGSNKVDCRRDLVRGKFLPAEPQDILVEFANVVAGGP